MARAWLALMLALAAPCAAGLDDGDTGSRPATSNEVSEIQDYTRALSKEWLKQYLAIDLDAISLRMKRRVWQSVTPPGAASQAVEEASSRAYSGAIVYAMDLRLEQYDDLRRLQGDPRDIPFAVRFDADSGFFGESLRLRTSLFVPLSWKDEMRAEASMPLPSLAPRWMGGLLDESGFQGGWDLKSSYGNRLGVSTVQAGLGTQWLKLWSVSYELRYRFGQEVYEESQWLKFGRNF